MQILKNIDEDQKNLLKCAGTILVAIAIAGAWLGFGFAAFTLFLCRLIVPFFWRRGNKSEIKDNKLICSLRNKIFSKTQFLIFFFINIITFIPSLVVLSLYSVKDGIFFFVPIFLSFVVSYIYQFVIKSPPATFTTMEPDEEVFSRDPFKKSYVDENPGRYDILQNYNIRNIYYDS